MEKIRVHFTTAYGGGVRADVYVGEEKYVLELDYLEKYIVDKFEKHGYTTSITSRQKFPRISFNVEVK